MLIQVSTRNFIRYKFNKGPILCFYEYRNNFINQIIMGEIEKLERQYMSVTVWKIEWLEHKKYLRLTENTQCNRVFVYYKNEIILDYCPPDFLTQLPQMFKKCKELLDNDNMSSNANYLGRQMTYKTIQLKKEPPISNAVNGIVNNNNNDIFLKSNNTNIPKTNFKSNENMRNNVKNISQYELMQKYFNKNSQKRNFENNYPLSRNMNEKMKRLEELLENKIFMKYFLKRYNNRKFYQNSNNRKIGFYCINRGNKRFSTNSKIKNGISKHFCSLIEKNSKENNIKRKSLYHPNLKVWFGGNIK